MAKAGARTRAEEPRRLPRGRHALAPEEVAADQRRRLLEAVPQVVAEQGYEAMSVAGIVKAAAVSRTVFYANFGSKQECFAAAHEACHERLLAVFEERCERGMSVEERVETALGAGLAMLAAEPAVTNLLFVEAPGAGREVALRHHESLRRYATLLRSAVPGAAEKSSLAAEIDQVVVGGIATRVASETLSGRARDLRQQIPHLVAYLLAFYAPSRASEAADASVPEGPEQLAPRATGRRRSAGA
jgi:AcrR family transcriptional regulator